MTGENMRSRKVFEHTRLEVKFGFCHIFSRLSGWISRVPPHPSWCWRHLIITVSTGVLQTVWFCHRYSSTNGSSSSVMRLISHLKTLWVCYWLQANDCAINRERLLTFWAVQLALILNTVQMIITRLGKKLEFLKLQILRIYFTFLMHQCVVISYFLLGTLQVLKYCIDWHAEML